MLHGTWQTQFLVTILLSSCWKVCCTFQKSKQEIIKFINCQRLVLKLGLIWHTHDCYIFPGKCSVKASANKEMLWKNCFSTQGTIFWQQCFLVCHGLNLLEQWSFTGGRDSSLAISVFLISLASFTCNITDIKLLLQSTDYTLTKLYLAQLLLHQINELI